MFIYLIYRPKSGMGHQHGEVPSLIEPKEQEKQKHHHQQPKQQQKQPQKQPPQLQQQQQQQQQQPSKPLAHSLPSKQKQQGIVEAHKWKNETNKHAHPDPGKY